MTDKVSEIKMNGHVKSIGKGRSSKRRQSEIVTPIPKKIKGKKREPQISQVKVDLSVPAVEGGLVLTCGMGDVGQLGLGLDVEEKSRPACVPDLKDIVCIAAGGLHSLCLDSNGRMFSWGCNDEGALGRVTSLEEENFCVKEVDLQEKVVQITAGDCHSAALTEDGRVFAWGSFRDNSGPLGFVEKDNVQKSPRQLLEGVPVIKVASGNSHLAMLTHSGMVYTCGCGETGQLGRVAEVFATRESRNRKGTENLLEPLPLKVFKARKSVLFDDVWAGGYVTFVKARDTGTIYGFGLNNFWQMGDEDTNMKFQPYLLKAFIGKKWKMFASGQHHSLALDVDGNVYVMGRNDYGRLGMGEGGKDCLKPTVVPSLSGKKIMSVAAGQCVSFALSEDGTVYAFGMGTSNQLGQGNEEDVWEPAAVHGKQLQDKKVLAVSAGGQHTVFLAVPL